MMSSSELQRIALSTFRVVQPTGAVEVQPIENDDNESTIQTNEEDNSDKDVDSNDDSAGNNAHTNIPEPPIAKQRAKALELSLENNSLPLTNGLNISNSPNRANETITSSIGDITVDSVRDHLNTTTTTLCSTTTEETVGK